MLEIFLVFRLSRDVGKIAERKGLSLRRWKSYAVLLWFAGSCIITTEPKKTS